MTETKPAPSTPPKVFISYSWDSSGHATRVRELADQLCRDGVDCTIDQYVDSPAEGWPRWMIAQVRNADYILVVCTETYLRRCLGQESQGTGLGARWESHLTSTKIYEAGTLNRTIIPLVFRTDDTSHIPEPLNAYTHYNLGDTNGYDRLFRRLTNQPAIVKPRVAPSPAEKHPHNVTRREGIGPDGDNPPENEGGAQPIELVIDQDFDSFSGQDQERLLKAIKNILGIGGELRIRSKRRGSVILQFVLTPSQAKRLYDAVQAGKLSDMGVSDARLLSRHGSGRGEVAVALADRNAELPEIGHPEAYYARRVHEADLRGNALAHDAYKVGQFITLGLDRRIAWGDKLKYFRHALKRHCTPPPLADEYEFLFYQQLADLVRQFAGQEALRLASAEDDLYAARLQMGQTREQIENDAEVFFNPLIPSDNRPEWFTESDYEMLKQIRGQWL